VQARRRSPGTGAASRSHGTDPVVPLAATLPRACARTRDQKGTSMLLEDRDAVSYGAGGVIGGGVAKVLARSGPGTSRGSRWST
jgi:hypothetical protein